MTSQISDISKRIKRIKTFVKGERRAPHKPLLLLLAIAETIKGNHEIPFDKVRIQLAPLLDAYAPPVKGRHQPELPYWHLQADGLWELESETDLQFQKGGFPTIASLRKSRGKLSRNFSELLIKTPAAAGILVNQLLEEFFPESAHEEILERIGFQTIDTGARNEIEESATQYRSLIRDPNFRKSVLRAYEHECVVTGFRASLSGSYFGCEAAHVKWHAYNGPDQVSNGISLEPTMHKLFDAGAWTLTDDRRVLVSAEYTGSDSALGRLRSYHGKPIKNPIIGETPVSVEFIRWHRLSKQGGVFREPALTLD